MSRETPNKKRTWSSASVPRLTKFVNRSLAWKDFGRSVQLRAMYISVNHKYRQQKLNKAHRGTSLDRDDHRISFYGRREAELGDERLEDVDFGLSPFLGRR